MKIVISGQELQEKMTFAVNLLCNTVKSTIGPKGSNIIIDHSAFSPFITNDGVTIAQNIESEDQITNTILELAKEASIKTNDLVGDGTTTTLVLLQVIFNEGLKEINNGKNPIILKKELEESLSKIIIKIKEESKKSTLKDLENIALTSSSSKEIAKIITEAFKITKNKESIKIIEQENNSINLIYKKGYSIDTLLASPYFFADKKEISEENLSVILINNYIQEIEEISIYLNDAITNKKSLIVLAEDYSELVINEVLSINEYSNNKIYLLKIPEYGKNKYDLLKDLELITKAKIINDLANISFENLGLIENIKIDCSQSTFYFNENNKINEKIKELKSLFDNTEEYNEYLAKRISMLETGIIEILIGAPTITERREKKMRADDCLCAINSAKDGFVTGSGLTLYKISDSFQKENQSISNILLKALQEPFKEIMFNSGLDYKEIISEIKLSNYQKVYNVISEKFENIASSTVKDPTKVVIDSLINATSIASILLTTTSLIVNEYKNNTNKINDFNDL